MKVTASETIRYFAGAEYSSATGWKRVTVPLGREKLVEYSNGVTYFFHSDHLGTPKVKTDHTGTVMENWDSYPYGEQWVAGSPGDQHRFTGHLRDSESNNDYAGVRYYSSKRGRWLSTDPELGDWTTLGMFEWARSTRIDNIPVIDISREGVNDRDC